MATGDLGDKEGADKEEEGEGTMRLESLLFFFFASISFVLVIGFVCHYVER